MKKINSLKNAVKKMEGFTFLDSNENSISFSTSHIFEGEYVEVITFVKFEDELGFKVYGKVSEKSNAQQRIFAKKVSNELFGNLKNAIA